VDDKEMYQSIKDYVQSIAPDKVKILQQYKGSRHIFDNFDINRQIKASFGKTSTMSSGAYIVIEHTEAMHVIDVNSGPKMQKKDQEDAAMAVNLEAAEEIARQLRLRDIGGLIIVDFIDMRTSENKASLYNKMKDFMQGDRAQHTILPLSKFGLMQITRQRTRPEVNIDTTELCPVCLGTGKVNPSILIIDNIQRDIEYIIQSRPKSKLKLVTNQFIYAYLKSGWSSIQMKWFMKYKKWISLNQNPDFHLFEYKFYDEADDEIRLS
jgi:ribonuclease G